jgi:hypothetical protein
MRERASTLGVARWALLALGLLGLLGTGCVVHNHYGKPGPVVVEAPAHKHKGPPPHAPAHGYRRKHAPDGVELAYDDDLDVYVAVGHSGVYWHGDRYFCWRDGGWRVSAKVDGVWVSVASQEVPPRLQAKYAKEKPHGRGRGHGRGYPAKHGY